MEQSISEIIKSPHQLGAYCLLTIALTSFLLFFSKKNHQLLEIIEIISPFITALTVLFALIYAFYPDNLNFWIVMSSLSLTSGMLIPRHILKIVKSKKISKDHELLMQAVHQILNEEKELK